METKEQLVQQIKGWMANDNELRDLQNRVKELKDKRKSYADNLVEIMRKNEIDCFDINGGSLVYKKNKVKKPINAKTLMSTLKNYFTSNPVQAEEITKYVMDNREEQIKETIKRKIDK